MKMNGRNKFLYGSQSSIQIAAALLATSMLHHQKGYISTRSPNPPMSPQHHVMFVEGQLRECVVDLGGDCSSPQQSTVTQDY